MNLGAEPKKVAILGILVVGIVGIYVYNSSSGDSSPSPSPRAAVYTAPGSSTIAGKQTKAPIRNEKGEFHARVLGSRPEDPGPESIDPALRLDLLAKVAAVQPLEGGRNLFQFSVAPAPDKPMPAVPTGVPSIPITRPTPPPAPVEIANTTPQPPPVQPLTFKYYGIVVSKADGRRQAFLQDGDDILFGQENEVLKRRYRIVKIAATSIDIEDTQAKNTQTLKIQEIPPS